MQHINSLVNLLIFIAKDKTDSNRNLRNIITHTHFNNSMGITDFTYAKYNSKLLAAYTDLNENDLKTLYKNSDINPEPGNYEVLNIDVINMVGENYTIYKFKTKFDISFKRNNLIDFYQNNAWLTPTVNNSINFILQFKLVLENLEDSYSEEKMIIALYMIYYFKQLKNFINLDDNIEKIRNSNKAGEFDYNNFCESLKSNNTSQEEILKYINEKYDELIKKLEDKRSESSNHSQEQITKIKNVIKIPKYPNKIKYLENFKSDLSKITLELIKILYIYNNLENDIIQAISSIDNIRIKNPKNHENYYTEVKNDECLMKVKLNLLIEANKNIFDKYYIDLIEKELKRNENLNLYKIEALMYITIIKINNNRKN